MMSVDSVPEREDARLDREGRAAAAGRVRIRIVDPEIRADQFLDDEGKVIDGGGRLAKDDDVIILDDRQTGPSLDDENTDLFESGIIDSMGVIELVSFIEERYDVSLDAKQMSADNFKTVNSILSLIQKVDC